MGKPYSQDLRHSEVQSGQTYEEAADIYGVSVSSVSRFLTRWRATGSVEPEKFGGYKGYALEAYKSRIARWMDEQPDVTLSELQARLAKQKVAVSQSSIFRFLRHLGVTLERSLHAAEQDRPDVAAARKAWFRMQPKLDHKKLVFIDETAASTNMTRRYGRATRGERLVCKVTHGHWKTSTFVAGLRHNRVTETSPADVARRTGPMLSTSDRCRVLSRDSWRQRVMISNCLTLTACVVSTGRKLSGAWRGRCRGAAMNRNVIYCGCAFSVLIVTFVVMISIGISVAYSLFAMLFCSTVTVSSLHVVLWNWNELTPRERSWRVFGALVWP